ncbi:MAG: hypothetical protein ACFFD4_07405 [Candidatus Odinarchaeota archaeon]
MREEKKQEIIARNDLYKHPTKARYITLHSSVFLGVKTSKKKGVRTYVDTWSKLGVAGFGVRNTFDLLVSNLPFFLSFINER